MKQEHTYQIFSSGDSAVTIDFGNSINELISKKIISLFYSLKNHPVDGFREIVPAYSSLTVYYDTLGIKRKFHVSTAYDYVKRKLEDILIVPVANIETEPAHVRIPVWYHGEDLGFIAAQKNISVEEVIAIHSSVVYRVYMLGFLPGFPYMAAVDERISIGRKEKPTGRIEPGSVGIAGQQTGIYPLASPGGWRIIGRTPVKLFDTENKYPVMLQPGDSVEFYAITEDEFKNY